MIAAVRYVREALANPELDLTPTARVVLFAMAAHANKQTGESYVSMARLASIAGTSERQVRRARVELAASGLLDPPSKRPGRSTVWTFPTTSPLTNVIDHPARRRSTDEWCDSSCPRCHGTWWVRSDEGDWMVECPERGARSAS